MLKQVLIAAAAVTAFATPAFASDVPVVGTVQPMCSVNGNGQAINFGSNLIGADGYLNPSNAGGTSYITGVWCNNANATITVEGNILTNEAVNPADYNTAQFTNQFEIEYIVEDNATGDDIAGFLIPGLEYDGAPLGIYAGDLRVSARPNNSGGLRLVAGAYTGAIQVTINPGA